LLAAFKDNSELFGDSVKSRLWNFGDGNTSAQQNPTNTFNSGRYNISLTIETQHGCVDTSTKSNAVTAGNKPVAEFNAVPLTGCASRVRQFNNQSTGNITDSKWNFGDGGVSFDKHPLYYFQDSGKFYVKLVVSDNGCKDSIIKPDYIYVEAPAGRLLTTFDCKDRFTVTFTDRTKGALTRLWDFGDGQTSTDIKAVHTYDSPGMYVVQLSVKGINCSDLERDTVYIKTTLPKVVVSPADSLHCKNRPLQFAVTDFDSAVSKYFSWDFKDGVITPSRSTTAVIFHTYKQAGVYQPYVDITDYAKCHDTIPILNPIEYLWPNSFI
jgi:PKD repeat protein